jgi:hypothetical protein
MTIALTSSASIRGSLAAARDGGNAQFPVDERNSVDVSNGTGAGQANAVYVDDFSIPASSNLDIDLSGALADALGGAAVFTVIKEILIVADKANANNVVVGGAPSNAFVGPFADATDKITLKPGGRLNVHDGYSAAGWTVTAATGDILRLANSGSGTAVLGTITIVGEVA